MRDKRSVLVTGTTGFVGSRVLRELLAHGHEAWTIGRSRVPPPGVPVWRHATIDLAATNLAEALGNLPRVDAVVHMAATPKLAGGDAVAMERLHVDASEVLARWAGRRSARFLHISTAFVGPDDRGHLGEAPATERNARGSYEVSKTRAEAAVMRACPELLEIMRPPIVLPSAADPVEDLMQSPLGTFLLAAGRPGLRLGLTPASASALPFVWRDDVAMFLAGRLGSEPAVEPRFWNLVPPDCDSAAELLTAGGYASGGQSTRLTPWRRYLEGSRTWDSSGYLEESSRLGIPARRVTIREILDVAAAVRAHRGGLCPDSEETPHAISA